MWWKRGRVKPAIQIDETFPGTYEVEELPELPGRGRFDVPVFYFTRATKTRPEHDGLWLKVRPRSGKSWVGVFGFGYAEPPAISRVLSTPDPDRVCIVSMGAYIVKPDQPDLWAEIPIMPGCDVRPVSEHQLLVFADLTRLAAYGRNGLVWRSLRVCWDELKILTLAGDWIEGVGYEPTSLDEMRFAVDLRTGCSLLPSPVSNDGKPLW